MNARVKMIDENHRETVRKKEMNPVGTIQRQI
jgi:hypothetical protein